MTPQQAYDELVKHLSEAALLSSTMGVLNWDQRVIMPKSGVETRAKQLSFLAGLHHRKITDPKIGDLLSSLETSDLMKNPESPEAVNIREIRYDYSKATKLPQALVEEVVSVTSLAETAWEEARAKRDFKSFQPSLEKIFNLTRQVADAYGYTKEPYDALLDNFEKGATTADVAKVFEGLRVDLVELLQKIKDASHKPDVTIVERAYDVELQRIFGEAVAEAIGYDFRAGRLDITTHPFCSGIAPGDTRITTRYQPHRLNDALFGIMHEAGHALYEMGLQKDKYFGLPMGEAVSLGIHESQSRMWENQVGRSRAFWVYFFPQLKRMFRKTLEDVSVDQFYGAINDVRPSYIRVEADEATYNLHILLRFELERAILNKELKTQDVAGEWNNRFKKYFGIAVDHDSNGCLQDVHWAAGLIGYFPTYTLGNLYSAQFFAKAKADIPDLMGQFERGNFLGLLGWLRENIHRQGQKYRSRALGEKVTGQSLNHKPLIDYLYAKYGEIYGIKR